MRELMNKAGETGQDNLIAGVFPPAEFTGVTIRALAKETVLARGTVLAKSSIDGKLVILGTEAAEAQAASGGNPAVPAETLTAAYILSDDTLVGTEDVGAAAYRAGCFNTKALTVAEGYELTEADRDDLRKYRIVLNDNMQ